VLCKWAAQGGLDPSNVLDLPEPDVWRGHLSPLLAHVCVRCPFLPARSRCGGLRRPRRRPRPLPTESESVNFNFKSFETSFFCWREA
jgi:hypothetical protein